jgi:hypothetical protein
MMFSPTALGRREEPNLLTLGGRRATMAVGEGGAGSGAPPAKLRAPAWASASGETPGPIDLAETATDWRDDELHMAARVLTIADQNSP